MARKKAEDFYDWQVNVAKGVDRKRNIQKLMKKSRHLVVEHEDYERIHRLIVEPTMGINRNGWDQNVTYHEGPFTVAVYDKWCDQRADPPYLPIWLYTFPNGLYVGPVGEGRELTTEDRKNRLVVSKGLPHVVTTLCWPGPGRVQKLS